MRFAGRSGSSAEGERPKSLRRKGRKAGLFVGSAAFHAALFVIAFSSASGDLVSAGGASGGPEGPVFAVTLVRMTPPSKTMSSKQDDLQPLFAKLQIVSADAAPIHASEKRTELSSLADRLRPPEPPKPPTEPRRERSAADAQGSPSPSEKALSRSRGDLAAARGEEGLTSADAPSGDLWGRIEPCWRKLPAKAKVAVTIRVALDGQGRLRTPPSVMRTDRTNLDDTRLRAEERALAALAACMPRSEPRFGGRSYDLEFKPVGD